MPVAEMGISLVKWSMSSNIVSRPTQTSDGFIRLTLSRRRRRQIDVVAIRSCTGSEHRWMASMLVQISDVRRLRSTSSI